MNVETTKDSNPANIGKTPAGVPASSGRMWVNYEFTDTTLKGLSVGAGLYGASKQAVEASNTFYTEAFATIDAKIGYKWNNIEFSIVGKNLANRKYFVPYTYFDGRVAPAAGTEVFSTVSIKF